MTTASSADQEPVTPSAGDVEATADRLHSAAIHLLRSLRVHDPASGLSAARLSALSVVVFAGPMPLGKLAAAEQLRAPTMSRLVGELEARGLVRRRRDPKDGRVRLVEATAKGRRVLDEGRGRRVEALAEKLAGLTEDERRILGRAAALLEQVALPEDHPSRDAGGGGSA